MTDKKTLNLIIFSSATIISDQPEEIKKETKYYLSFSFWFDYNRLSSVSSPF